MFACGKTCVLAGRFNCLVDYYVVSKLINGFLRNKNLVTYRTMLTFGKTCVLAVGSNCRINHFGMRKLVNSYLLSADFIMAD